MEMSNGVDGEFKTVRSRKRKSKDKMDTDGETSEPTVKRPHFPQISGEKLLDGSKGFRKIPVPPNRYSPLKENWLKIYSPVVEQLKLQIRFNLKTRNVELQTSKHTADIGALQRGADFVKAFILGFTVEDALALVRLDELFLESFQVTDVKPLKGDHLSRAIGRVAGSGGRTKFTIENVTKTRIVLADSVAVTVVQDCDLGNGYGRPMRHCYKNSEKAVCLHIHILGSYQNIRLARTAICNLILGSPPSKVYGNLRSVAGRVAERF